MRVLIVLFLMFYALPAMADCAIPAGTGTNDVVVSFAAPSGGHAGSVTSGSLGGTASEGSLLYDKANKNLKLCDGSVWEEIDRGRTAIDTYAAALGITVTPVAGLKKWPDYIICTYLTRPFILPFLEYYSGSVLYYTTEQFWYRFTVNGAPHQYSTNMSATCGAPAGDIVSICNAGRCGFY